MIFAPRKPKPTATGSPKMAAMRSYGMAVAMPSTVPISTAPTSGKGSMIGARSPGQIGFAGPAPRSATRKRR